MDLLSDSRECYAWGASGAAAIHDRARAALLEMRDSADMCRDVDIGVLRDSRVLDMRGGCSPATDDMCPCGYMRAHGEQGVVFGRKDFGEKA